MKTQKKITPLPEPTHQPFMTPALDCNKPAFRHLKHRGRSFVTMDSRPLPRVWEK